MSLPGFRTFVISFGVITSFDTDKFKSRSMELRRVSIKFALFNRTSRIIAFNQLLKIYEPER